MTGLKTDITADEINRAIADAIAKSALGQMVIEGVNEYVKRLPSSYDSPIKKAIEAEAQRLVVRLVTARALEIELEVRKQITAEIITSVVQKAVEKFMRSIE